MTGGEECRDAQENKPRAIVGMAACMNGSGTRSLTALYVAAPFSMGYVDFYTFLMPLYALSLGFDAAEVGILVGARSIVAMFLSIHTGVLMDRFGTCKVTLFFVWASMVLAPLFPLVPWFWSLLVLQLVNGATVSFGWSGAQTLIAQLATGEARHLGRFTFFAQLGSTAAQMLGGAVWDFGGTWPEIASGFGALFAGRVMSLGNAQRTMLSGTVISILLIALTPLLGGMLALLLLFQVMRGLLEGVIQPLVLSVQARAAGRHQQGAVVGLRQTGQRFTSIVVPPIMGAIERTTLCLSGFRPRGTERGQMP